MEPSKKQTTIKNYFQPKNPPLPPKKPFPFPPQSSAMEIEDDDVMIIETPPTNFPLTKLPLPHQNPKLWSQCRPIYESFASKKITNFPDFFKSMSILMSFSLGYKKPGYDNLVALFTEFKEIRKKQFFDEVLPCLGRLALTIESLFTEKEPVKRLLENTQVTLLLSKHKVACLVIHMFFCTIYKETENTKKPDKKSKEEGRLNRNWNFSQLLQISKDSSKNNAKIEKLKCVYHYFERLNDILDMKITYIRVCMSIKSEDFWLLSKKPLTKVHLKDDGFIEDYIKNTIQLDFANKYLGGGVLFQGLVQEEIRFCINPELFPSMILYDCLKDNEAAIIIGTEQYSSYTGYKELFKYSDDFKDPAENIENDPFQKDVVILAIDAIKYFNPNIQFKKEEVLRELNKAFIGFHGNGNYPEGEKKRAIATGRWGCGAYHGNSQLKFLIQWIACAECEREMYFYRNKDKELEDIENVIASLEKENVGSVMKAILDACGRIYYQKDPRTFFHILFS